MEELKEQVFKFRNPKENTWTSYARNIRQLAVGITEEEYKNNDFLLDVSKVNNWISENSSSDSKRRLYYAVILLMLQPDRSKSVSIQQSGEKNVYLDYQKELKKFTEEYLNEKREQKKSQKQSDNWVDWTTIKKGIKSYRKFFIKNKTANWNTKEGRQFLQDWLIYSLYTQTEPRRLDYADMKVIDKKNYNKLDASEKEEHNFLVLTGKIKKQFSFGKKVQKNKNIDENGIQQSVYMTRVPKAINSVLNIYLKYSPEEQHKENFITRTLLYMKNGKPMTKDGLSKNVMRIMKDKFNKKISPTMLRTIFISNQQKDDVKLKLKIHTAKQMGHTPGIAEQYYAKK